MLPIRILVTGGTFDKEYNELTGELFFKETHLGDMLRLGRCRLEVEVETLMMIDSLQMTDDDRRVILAHCAASPQAIAAAATAYAPSPAAQASSSGRPLAR